jgi:hypothetical protein
VLEVSFNQGLEIADTPQSLFPDVLSGRVYFFFLAPGLIVKVGQIPVAFKELAADTNFSASGPRLSTTDATTMKIDTHLSIPP